MIKRKPTIISHRYEPNGSQKNTSVQLLLQIDHDLADFSGHFTDLPLLPGVTQIRLAVELAHQFLATPPLFVAMEVIKFQQPIFPDMRVTLDLRWDENKEKLHFRYFSLQILNQADVFQEINLHSSGRIKLTSTPF